MTPAQFVQNLIVTGNEFIPRIGEGRRGFYINPGVVNFTFLNNAILDKFASMSVTQAQHALLEHNTVTGDGGSAGIGTWGYPDPAVWGHATFRHNDISRTSRGITLLSQNVTLEENLIHDNAQGVRVSDEYGGFDVSTLHINGNSITGNSEYGVVNTTTTVVDAQGNWWGTAHGPLDVLGPNEIDASNCGTLTVAQIRNALPAGLLGNAVSENVDYCPWDDTHIHIEVEDCPIVLNAEHPSKTVAIRFLGGANAPLFGYSLVFKYKPSVVSIAKAEILEGTFLGSGTTFNVTKLPDEVIGGEVFSRYRIDAARLNQSLGGVSAPGTMFTVKIYAAAACGSTPLILQLLNARDPNNAPITGMIAGPCDITVDTQPPVVASVAVTNTTVFPITGSHEWTKDGDALVLTATVTNPDACGAWTTPLTITANLSPLGGGSAVLPDVGGTRRCTRGPSRITRLHRR
ncbi:MAG: right-handed parallel beta-helix repeat-containing protein [Ignavibacteria bacterium]|nr:right-handed parallel beta-helix repeat-containing protein [Ignavibacteria bacterium]